jgi:dipeptidyl aminopeptidase/acylaminoacyl peptidase
MSAQSISLRTVVAIAMLATNLSMDVYAAGSVTHHVTFDDLKEFNYAEFLSLSPDGKMLSYTVHANPYIWIVATRPDSKPRKLAAGTFPQWSPDGKKLAYYSSKSGTSQLWVFDIVGKQAVQLTHLRGGIAPDAMVTYIGMNGGTLFDSVRYGWSPDSSQLVFTSQVKRASSRKRSSQTSATSDGRGRTVRPLVLTTETPAQLTLSGVFSGGYTHTSWVNGKQVEVDDSASPTETTEDHLFVIDVHTKSITQLTHDSAGYFTPSWSPDGKTVVCMSNERRPLQGWGSGPTNIFALNVATGQKTALTHDGIYKTAPKFSPDGKWLSYFGSEASRADDIYLFVMPSGGGSSVNLSVKLDRRILDAEWSTDSQSIIVNYEDGVDWPIGRLQIPSGDVEILGVNDSSAMRGPGEVAVSRSGTMAWKQSDPMNPGTIQVLSSARARSYELVDLNPKIKGWQLPRQEIIHWKSSRGEDREGMLIKPLNYEEGHRYPLIVDTYPGIPNAFKSSTMGGNVAWATKGYAVLWPDAVAPHFVGSKQVSRQESARGVNGLALMLDDVNSAVDELISRGVADPDRICLYGFSNGAAEVNQLVTMTDRFKCAVSVAGALSADWSMPFFLQTNATFIPLTIGATPWQDPQTYIKLSAVYRLDKVNTPMLLADGDQDSFFLLGTIEMYNGLRYLGKDVVFLRYPNQGHGFSGPAMKDFWERENAFFDRYLHPEKPPT